MANEIKTALGALETGLANIPGLRVVQDGAAADGWSDFPLAQVRLASRDAARIGFGGSSFEGEIVITVAVAGERAADLLPFIEPLGAASVEAAIDSDSTLNGAVDYARLVEVSGVGIRQIGGRRRMAADFRVRFVKQASGA